MDVMKLLLSCLSCSFAEVPTLRPWYVLWILFQVKYLDLLSYEGNTFLLNILCPFPFQICEEKYTKQQIIPAETLILWVTWQKQPKLGCLLNVLSVGLHLAKDCRLEKEAAPLSNSTLLSLYESW